MLKGLKNSVQFLSMHSYRFTFHFQSDLKYPININQKLAKQTENKIL